MTQLTSIELGIVSSMDKRDEYITTIAEVKRNIARAERALAEWRAKEAFLLHQVECITRDVAVKRLSQADLNMERVKFYQKQYVDNPRLVNTPQDILATMTRPSISLADSMRAY